MRNPHGLDYDQPSRDALAGIYVEVSDSAPASPAAELPPSQEKPVMAQAKRLFGLALSLNKSNKPS